MEFMIEPAGVSAAAETAVMVGELLDEIMGAIGVAAFHFDREETTRRLRAFLSREKYFVFIARNAEGDALGFLALSESHALYAEGAFGIIPEFYVRPAYRSHGVGTQLLARARAFATNRGWKRLEVSTPPLPPFEYQGGAPGWGSCQDAFGYFRKTSTEALNRSVATRDSPRMNFHPTGDRP